MTIHHDKLAYGKLASSREDISEEKLLQMLEKLNADPADNTLEDSPSGEAKPTPSGEDFPATSALDKCDDQTITDDEKEALGGGYAAVNRDNAENSAANSTDNAALKIDSPAASLTDSHAATSAIRSAVSTADNAAIKTTNKTPIKIKRKNAEKEKSDE